MIVWLRGDVEYAAAVARIAAAALVERGFQACVLEREPGGTPETLARRAREAGEETVILALAASDAPPDGLDAHPHALTATDAPGHAAEALLDALERAGALSWGYSHEEEEAIQKHLEDLGYL